LRNPHVESGNASREIPAKKDQDQEQAKLPVRFKTLQQKTRQNNELSALFL
jgi:hypothetical protein